MHAPFPLKISSNLNESIVEKQLYAGKVPSFPTFVTINGNILSFLYKKSSVGIRPLISSRCSLVTGQFAQWSEHGKSYCVGVRRFMFEVWLFVPAHRARLPDTVDFLCAEVGGPIPTFDFSYEKLKILPFMVTNVGKDGTFPACSCFSTMDSFRFEEIVSGNGAFQEI